MIKTDSDTHTLRVIQITSHLTHNNAIHIIAHARQSPLPVLLLAPHVGSLLAEKLADAGINYMDASGNCHLQLGPVFIEIRGQRPPPRPSSAKGMRAPAYQVLFAYLALPDLLKASLRDVATAAAVSRQPVSDVRRRLLDGEYVVQTKSATRWVPDRWHDALSLWLHGYETVVRRALLWGAYRTQATSPRDVEAMLAATYDLAPSDFRWGGCSAGFRFCGHYRGPKTTLHLRHAPRDLRKLRAAAHPRGNLVFLNAFGPINWEFEGETVHPLLVYSEMLNEGGERAAEAAQIVFEQHIEPRWAGR